MATAVLVALLGYQLRAPVGHRWRVSSAACCASSADATVPRREALRLAAGAAALTSVQPTSAATDRLGPTKSPERAYGPLLQGPFDFPSASRATVRRELIPGRMWSFEQVQVGASCELPPIVIPSQGRSAGCR